MHQFNKFKVAIRNVNSHALVNSAFMAIVAQGRITSLPIFAFGNLAAKQYRMTKTEAVSTSLWLRLIVKMLVGAPLSNPATLQQALATLSSEMKIDESLGRSKYRHDVALDMFYKFYLSLLPAGSIPPNIASGMTKFSRGVSSGEQSYQVCHFLTWRANRVDRLIQVNILSPNPFTSCEDINKRVERHNTLMIFQAQKALCTLLSC